MKISKFVIGAPDTVDEMSADIMVSIPNECDEDVRWVQCRMIVEDARGFPLQCIETAEDCRLAPQESLDVSSGCTLLAPTAGSRRDDVVIRAFATLFARDFVRLGEIEVPSAELGQVPVLKTLQSAVIGPEIRGLAIRTKTDEEGQGRVECRVLVQNRGTWHLERISLKCELLDADDAPIEEGEDSVSVPAGMVACVDGGTPWVKTAQLRKAKVRLSLSVFRPVRTLDCSGTSVPEGDAEDSDRDGLALACDADGASDEAEEPVASEVQDDQESGDEETDDEGDDETDGDEDGDSEGAGESAEDGLEPRVAAVLKAAGALEHADAFRTNQITDDVLHSLTDVDLVAMGVSAIGLRKRILAAIAVALSKDSTLEPRPIDWARVIEPLRAALAPASRAVLNPVAGHKKLEGARSYATQVTPATRLLMVYDDTMFGSGKDGMLVSELGVHWRNAFEDPQFIPWGEFGRALASGKKIVFERNQPGAGGHVGCAMGGAAAAEAMARLVNRAAGAAMAWVEHSRHPQWDGLRAALLQMGGVEENAHVSLDDDESGAFVQFCAGDDGPRIDIPITDARDARVDRLCGFVDQLDFETERGGDFTSHWREFAAEEVDRLLALAFRVLFGGQGVNPRLALRLRRGWDPD